MGNFIFSVFDLINFLLVVILWVYTLKNYKKLPAKIPTHFDFDGKPDHFGSKGMIYLFPVLSTVFYIAFFFITKNPQTGNFPVEITKANSETQFGIMIFLMKWLLLIINLLFFNIQDYIIRLSFNENAKAKVHILFFVPIIFISVMGAIVTSYIYK